MVPLWLGANGLDDQALDLRDRCPSAQGRPEVYLVIREEAGAQLPVGGEPQAVALVAEVLADGGDEADGAPGPRQAIVAGWAAADAQLRRL